MLANEPGSIDPAQELRRHGHRDPQRPADCRRVPAFGIRLKGATDRTIPIVQPFATA